MIKKYLDKKKSIFISLFLIVILHDYISIKAIHLRNLKLRNKKSYNAKILKNLHEVYTRKINYTSSAQDRLPNDRYILIDCFPLPLWMVINSTIAHMIARKLNAKIKYFTFSKPSRESLSILNAFGIKIELRIRNRAKDLFTIYRIYSNIKKNLKNPHSVIEISLDGINLGIDIYESILRRSRATVSLEDHETYIQIYRGIKQYIFFKDRFEKKEILAILVSHDNYIGPGLLSRIAYKYEVPVLLANMYGISMPSQPFQLYSIFGRYKDYFDAISSKEQVQYLKTAENELKRRISGELNIGMTYQIKSAFENSNITSQIIRSSNTKVLILTHDFYDNPHGYGLLLFDDFLQWMNFLGELSLKTNYDWYVKCHRDYSPQELMELESFIIRYPNISIVNSEVSFIQLRNEGIEFALTCFGSVGHELPLLGITVVNNSNNPHIAYNFNVHARNLAEYEDIILNLPKHKITNFNYTDIYRFYTVHQYILNRDSYILDSVTEMLNYCSGNLESDETLKYILENVERIISNTDAAALDVLSNRRVHSIEKFLKGDFQQKIQLTSHNLEFFSAFD